MTSKRHLTGQVYRQTEAWPRFYLQLLNFAQIYSQNKQNFPTKKEIQHSPPIRYSLWLSFKIINYWICITGADSEIVESGVKKEVFQAIIYPFFLIFARRIKIFQQKGGFDYRWSTYIASDENSKQQCIKMFCFYTRTLNILWLNVEKILWL